MDAVARKPIYLPGTVDLTSRGSLEQLAIQGLARPEPEGSWTNARDVRLSFAIDPAHTGDVLLNVELAAFLDPIKLPEQRILVSVNATPCSAWMIREPRWQLRPIILPARAHHQDLVVSVGFAIPTCRAPAELDLGPDTRQLGINIRRLMFSVMPAAPGYLAPASTIQLVPGRRVGTEARRTYDEKIDSGFWARYITGPRVLDIGAKGNDDSGTPLQHGAGLPVIEGAIGIDLDFPGYDGTTLPFPSDSQDAVYSSHSLEHIHDQITAIREWHRVLKVGGHIIVAVPHAHLYERRSQPPSRWNGSHVRMYTAASLLAAFEAALPANSYRVRHLYEDDRGYRYEDPPDRHAAGGYEIELVVEKIRMPAWSVAA